MTLGDRRCVDKTAHRCTKRRWTANCWGLVLRKCIPEFSPSADTPGRWEKRSARIRSRVRICVGASFESPAEVDQLRLRQPPELPAGSAAIQHGDLHLLQAKPRLPDARQRLQPLLECLRKGPRALDLLLEVRHNRLRAATDHSDELLVK